MQHTIRSLLKRWMPAIICMAVIFWFSSQPDLPRPRSNVLNLILRKSAHFSIYGVLAVCYLRALGDRAKWRWALLLAVLYAISDEYHQSWTPRRQPAVTDVLIDTAGAATGLALWPWLQRGVIAKIARSWGADPDPASAEKRA